MDHPTHSNELQAKDKFDPKVIRRLRNELAIELGTLALCLILAVGLNFKIALTVVLACLRFAVADFLTAYLVLRYDPQRVWELVSMMEFSIEGPCSSEGMGVYEYRSLDRDSSSRV